MIKHRAFARGVVAGRDLTPRRRPTATLARPLYRSGVRARARATTAAIYKYDFTVSSTMPVPLAVGMSIAVSPFPWGLTRYVSDAVV